jgi:hypothetical protein
MSKIEKGKKQFRFGSTRHVKKSRSLPFLAVFLKVCLSRHSNRRVPFRLRGNSLNVSARWR